jgi:hypothetical protein
LATQPYSTIDAKNILINTSRLLYDGKSTTMKPKKPSPLSEAASAMGKKGGKRTLELHGPEHFSKASKARKVFGGGWPKGRPRKPKGGKKGGGKK